MRTGAGTCSTPRAGLSLSAFTARRKGTRGSRDMEVRELSPKGPPVEQIPGAPCTTKRWPEAGGVPAGLHRSAVGDANCEMRANFSYKVKTFFFCGLR